MQYQRQLVGPFSKMIGTNRHTHKSCGTFWSILFVCSLKEGIWEEKFPTSAKSLNFKRKNIFLHYIVLITSPFFRSTFKVSSNKPIANFDFVCHQWFQLDHFSWSHLGFTPYFKLQWGCLFEFIYMNILCMIGNTASISQKSFIDTHNRHKLLSAS